MIELEKCTYQHVREMIAVSLIHQSLSLFFQIFLPFLNRARSKEHFDLNFSNISPKFCRATIIRSTFLVTTPKMLRPMGCHWKFLR